MSESAAPAAQTFQGLQAEFEKAVYSGQNPSGVRVLGKNVLILMDQVAVKSAGGILLPPERIMQMNMASESGVLVELGVEAFSYFDDGTKWTDYKPKPGDRVFVERYGGRELRGRDGQIYRLMSYTCVGGIEMPEPVQGVTKRKKKG